MGDYGFYNGERFKVGTAGNLTDLRPDQLDKITFDGPMRIGACTFRFPFPDEDNTKPGGFRELDRGFKVWGYEIPREVEHRKIQFQANTPVGLDQAPNILMMLPCPLSDDGFVFAEANKIKGGYKDFVSRVKIVQQRIWEGVWATVLVCGGCGSKFRLPTIEDAAPLIAALEKMAEADERDKRSAVTIRTMAARVEIGYQTAAPITNNKKVSK